MIFLLECFSTETGSFFFVVETDNRSQAAESEWTDKQFMGPDQWACVKKSFATDFADCDTVLFGTPTPLVFISQS